MTDFQNLMQQERERLTKKRSELEAQITDLQSAIATVDRELRAIDAYDQARTGKQSTPRKNARTGTRKEAVLAILKEHPGIAPKDIIKHMPQGTAKEGIHNLLSSLKKDGTITVSEGKYRLV